LAALFGPGPETRGNERARLLALIGSLDDRDKIIAVHAILYRLRYNQLELLRTAGFTWNPVETFFGLPFKRDPKTGSLHPDLATSAVLASAWRSAFDQRVFSVSYATLISLSVLPILLWITRPRRNKPTLRRWLFNVASLLCLTAFAAILFLGLCPRLPGGFVGAYFFTTRNRQPAETLAMIDWHADTISVAIQQDPVGRGEWARSHDSFVTADKWPQLPRPYSMLAYKFNSTPRYDYLGFQARYYAAAPPFALLPILWLVTSHRRKRPSPGHCPQCHYDLRATPTRCPECGAITHQSSTPPETPA
jgi:hypothetical protein